MPEKSNKGISADGESVTLENTRIDGYINLQDDASVLSVKGNTTFKDVVAYFEGRTIAKTVVGENTVYKLATIE